jgi:DNA-binding MarR family transcriptional regulator
MDPALGGAELEQLLAVLLRMLSPAAVPPGSRPGGNDHAVGHAPASPTSKSSTPDGGAAGGNAPSGAAPGGAVLSGSAPGGSALGGKAPGDNAPGDSTPGGKAPGGSAPGASARGDKASGSSAPGDSAPGGKAPGDSTPSRGAPPGFPAVTASEARALTELLAAHGIAQGQLAALLGLEKSTVSRLAAGLESKGWIRRGRDEQNHRYVRLYLTPQGRTVAGRLWQAWQSRQARILAGLTAEERAGLATGLRGVLRGLVAEGLLAAPPPPNGQGC